MTSRRLVCVVVVLAVAGCFGGTPRVVATGTPATVEAAAVEAAGYEAGGTRTVTINATVQASVSGDVGMDARRPVTAKIPVTTYRRDTAAGPGLVLVAATPAVRPIENQPLVRDPLATRSPASLVSTVQSAYAVTDLAETEGRNVSFLGNETTESVYTGTGTRDGQSVPLLVGIASVRHDGEFVTVVTVDPASTADRDRVARLRDGLRH